MFSLIRVAVFMVSLHSNKRVTRTQLKDIFNLLYYDITLCASSSLRENILKHDNAVTHGILAIER